MRRHVFSLVLVAALSLAATATADPSRSSPMWVAPYHPCYQWDEVAPTEVPWRSVTHLIVGYLWPEQLTAASFTVAPPDWFGDQAWFDGATGYITAGHQAGRSVTCMLGGAGSNPGGIWNEATSEANVAGFAANIAGLLQPFGFDGVDLDWEDAVDYSGLVRLAVALRAAWPTAVITIPTSFTGEDAGDLAPAAAAVDAFMPMTYIPIEQWGGWTLPSPLTPLAIIGANKNAVDWVRQAWIDAGVAPSQLVMGVGGFGLAWGDGNGDGVAPIAPYVNGGSGPAAGETAGIASDNVVTQQWLTAILSANPGSFKEEWDAAQKISYWHTEAENVQATADNISLIFYETPEAMYAKVDYIAQQGMKGMMFWTLSQMRDGSSYPVLAATRVIFHDGFEVAGTSAWSSTVPSPSRAIPEGKQLDDGL